MADAAGVRSASTRLPRRRDGLWVLALAALACGLRLPNIARGYGVDEGISVGIASHPLHQIPALLRQDGSPPLFYALLHVWIALFGRSEVSTHTLVLGISVLVVPASWWAARRVFGPDAGLAAAALAATSPFLGWYSTETRMYTLVCLLSILAVTLAVLAERDRRGVHAVGATAAFAALVYSHNWGLYLAACTAAVLALRGFRRGDRQLLKGVLVSFAALAALYLPWVPSLLAQVRSTAAPWAVSPNLGDFFADPASAMGGTLGVVIAPLLAYGVLTTRRRQNPPDQQVSSDREAIGALAGAALATLAVGWLIAQMEPSWTIRYLAVVIAPLILAVAGALSTSRPGRRVVVVACSLLAGWSVVGALLPNPSARYAKSNVAAIARTAGPNLQAGDLVVLPQTEQLGAPSYYLPHGL
ncbi:MAG: glycosyltransferase family 39 protein, partial [Acidimicrobiales bacterium]